MWIIPPWLLRICWFKAGCSMQWTMGSVVVLELLKINLLVSYFLLALGQSALVISASFIFLAAFLLGRVLDRLGGRVVIYWVIMLAGVIISFFLLYDGPAWLTPIVIVAFVSACWFRGAWLAKQSPDHQFCLARFDEGLWLAVIVYSLAALTGLDNAMAEDLVYPLGFFSIISLGLSKTASKNSNGFSARHSGPTALSYAMVFMAAIVSLSLLVPLLVEPALWTSEKLAGVAFGFIQYFASIMDRFFALDPVVNHMDGRGLFPTHPSAIGDPEPGVHTFILLFILLAGVILSVVVLLGAGLVRLFKHLASSTEKSSGSSLVKVWLSGARLLWSRTLVRLKLLFMQIHLRPGQACLLYLRYQALGRRVGCARRAQETAREYARRLAHAFPVNAEQAGYVVEAFEKEFYGAQTLDTLTQLELMAISRKIGILSFFAEYARRVTRRAARHSTRPAFPVKDRLRL